MRADIYGMTVDLQVQHYGTVVCNGGRVTIPPRLKPLFDGVPITDADGKVLTPADGEAFMRALPLVLDDPYTFALLDEPPIPPDYFDVEPGAEVTPGVAKDFNEGAHPRGFHGRFAPSGSSGSSGEHESSGGAGGGRLEMAAGKMTLAHARSIRDDHAAGRTVAELAKRHGLSTTAVRNIVLHKTHREVFVKGEKTTIHHARQIRADHAAGKSIKDLARETQLSDRFIRKVIAHQAHKEPKGGPGKAEPRAKPEPKAKPKDGGRWPTPFDQRRPTTIEEMKRNDAAIPKEWTGQTQEREHMLEHAVFVETPKRLGADEGVNQTYVGTVRDANGVNHKVIVKPDAGAKMGDSGISRASYLIANSLGVKTPEVVIRDTPVGKGEVQYMVGGVKPAWRVTRQQRADLLKSEDAKKMALLDALIVNYDRHNANWMVGKQSDGRPLVVAIDHGLALKAGQGWAIHEGPALERMRDPRLTKLTGADKRALSQLARDYHFIEPRIRDFVTERQRSNFLARLDFLRRSDHFPGLARADLEGIGAL